MTALKFAIAGCGRIAKVHADIITALPGAELKAVCDADPHALHRFTGRYGVKGYLNYGEMLEKAGLDVVIICTPSGLHAAMGIQAARTGRHVLVEKPLALTLEDADRLIAACDEAGVLLAVVLQNRFKPPFRALKEAVEKGKHAKRSRGAHKWKNMIK
ncbi:MAG: Gfo/Idh/MocA family oxidoreductase [Firmicutes bacterium]|nr:Gfo/Idh/MocA family oxidoreductase [Bacillota bacterium]